MCSQRKISLSQVPWRSLKLSETDQIMASLGKSTEVIEPEEDWLAFTADVCEYAVAKLHLLVASFLLPV